MNEGITEDVPRKIGPSMKMELVTPEIAEDILSRNMINRAIRPRRVEIYAQDMLNGKWRESYEPVLIDWNDNLQNGQHRLTAIIKSQTTVGLFVVRGVNPDDMAVLDSGAPRTGADALGFSGLEKNRSKLATALTLVVKFRRGTIGKDDIVTQSELQDVFNEFDEGELHHAAALAQRAYRSCYLNQAAFTAWYLLSDPRRDVFAKQIIEGTNLTVSMPSHRLRKWSTALAQQRKNNPGSVHRAPPTLAVLFEAYLAFCEGKSIHRLVGWVKGQRFPYGIE